MLDRVARLTGVPCLLARGTRLGGVAFCHVNSLSRAISANQGEINCENTAAQREYFRTCSYHLPVLSAEQSVSRDQCNRRVSGREQARVHAGSWNMIEKSFLDRLLCLLCLAAAQEITHCPG